MHHLLSKTFSIPTRDIPLLHRIRRTVVNGSTPTCYRQKQSHREHGVCPFCSYRPSPSVCSTYAGNNGKVRNKLESKRHKKRVNRNRIGDHCCTAAVLQQTHAMKSFCSASVVVSYRARFWAENLFEQFFTASRPSCRVFVFTEER